MKFQPGKRYIFSKDKWLADTGNVFIYKNNPYIRLAVNKADGREVKIIFQDVVGRVAGLPVVRPEHCDEIIPEICTVPAAKVENIEDELLDRKSDIEEAIDKHAQLHEVINMLCMDKERLERRLKAINKELAQKELELHKVEKELMKWTRS